MQPNTHLEITTVLSSAITPVTLITGVAFLTSIMAPRFGRCIDRVRIIIAEIKKLPPYGKEYENHLHQLRILYARTKILRNTMTAGSICIMCVVLTITATFSQLIFGFPGPRVAAILFLFALAWLMILAGGFIYDFLRSLKAVKLEIEYALNGAPLSEAPSSEAVGRPFKEVS